MADLLPWLHHPGFLYATASCKDAMTNAAMKSTEYMEGTKQPALQLFKAVRMFDPKQLPLLSHALDDNVRVIPALANAAEWQGYLDTAAQDSLPDDITRFWQSLLDQDRLTQLAALAKAYLALPVSSVDVEWSFSKYRSVLSPALCVAFSQRTVSNRTARCFLTTVRRRIGLSGLWTYKGLSNNVLND